MGKYLLKVNYTRQGLEGVLKEGGSARRSAAQKAIQSVGGSIESFYFAFGEVDVYVLADFPDEASAAAAAMKVTAAGGASVQTVVLMEPDTVDEATQRAAAVDYRPPGS